MATLLQDTFTDTGGTNLTAHTMTVGSGWTVPAGAWVVDATIPNTALPTTDVTSNIAVADAGAADVVASVAASLPASLSTFAAGLLFRYVDLSNYWQLVIVNDNLELHDIVGGVDTTRDSTAVSGLGNTTVTFSVTTSGASISGSCGGFTVSYSSSQHVSATKYGLLNYVNTGSSYLFANWDNFLVTGAVADPGPTIPFVTRLDARRI